jgi:hypothetical protein
MPNLKPAAGDKLLFFKVPKFVVGSTADITYV